VSNLRALDRSIQAYQEGRVVSKTLEELRAMEE
jgi:exonuclease VII small subunit